MDRLKLKLEKKFLNFLNEFPDGFEVKSARRKQVRLQYLIENIKRFELEINELISDYNSLFGISAVELSDLKDFVNLKMLNLYKQV